MTSTVRTENTMKETYDHAFNKLQQHTAYKMSTYLCMCEASPAKFTNSF